MMMIFEESWAPIFGPNIACLHFFVNTKHLSPIHPQGDRSRIYLLPCWRQSIGLCFSPALVCLFFRTISKIDAARITILDTEMSHDEAWPHLFWGQKVKGQCHESEKHYRRSPVHSCECWFLLVQTETVCFNDLSFFCLKKFVTLFSCRSPLQLAIFAPRPVHIENTLF